MIDDLREKVRQFEDQYESPVSNRSSREKEKKWGEEMMRHIFLITQFFRTKD